MNDEFAMLMDGLPEQQTNAIIIKLKTGKITLETDSPEIMKETGCDRPTSIILHKILQSKKFSLEQTATVIELLQNWKTQATKDCPEMHLVWTGPCHFRIPQKSTYATLIEMIEKGEHTIKIVGYGLKDIDPNVIKSLSQAGKRGITITIIGDKMAENVKRIKKQWPENVPLPEMYTREENPEDTIQSLHAKLIIVDGNTLLITSANPTHHGLKSNIEVGLQIRGQIVREIEELFLMLITNKELVRFLP